MICANRQYPSFGKFDIHVPMNADTLDPQDRSYKERMARAGVNQTDAQQALDWSQTKVSRFVNGERKRVTLEERLAFEQWLEIVERRAGVETSGRGDNEGRVLDFPIMPAARRIPLYGLAAAGPNGGVHLDHDSVVDMIERIPAQGTRDDVFALEVFGDSMEPRYYAAERVYCVRNRQPGPGRDVIVELKSGDAYLKTYVAMRDGFVFCRQLNPDQECRYSLQDIRALHAVVGRS
ncbi:S24 family peptidase [Maricaulis sp.]|uniref:S24 family peptidase n=1 Tax=Maricaulis sp. TaxID=1486257 RepID=UPI003299CC55